MGGAEEQRRSAELAGVTRQIFAGLDRVRVQIDEQIRRTRRLREEAWAAQELAARLRGDAGRLRRGE